MFTGQVSDSKFKLYRVKKFGLMDYNVTLMRGEVKIDRESLQVELTFSLMWWYAGQILAEVFFIILFAILIAVNSNSEFRDVSIVALIGIPIIIFTTLSYKRKYEGDKEKYKSLLERLTYRSNVR